MTDQQGVDPGTVSSERPLRIALASRGDALTDYLLAALQRRYVIAGRIEPELTPRQRYQVAAVTVRPSRSRWAEQFYKSGYAYRLRSANAVRQLRSLDQRPDATVQVHALFAPPALGTAMYIDCTHRQSAEFWPPWNPLRGQALELWYSRERASYAAADHLFAFCEPTRNSLVEDYGIAPEKVTVTGAGANLDPLPELRAIPDQVRSDSPAILFIGNDFVRKGGEVLLEAFRVVRAEIPTARLLLVGTQPGIRPQPGVEVLGRINNRDRIAQLYAAATVFTVPSFFDPYPLVLLEAMSFGVPVVATHQTGTPEMVVDGETGRLIPPGSAEALAEALLAVLRDPVLAARLGAAGRRDVEQRFTWDAVVDRMAPALQQLARART